MKKLLKKKTVVITALIFIGLLIVSSVLSYTVLKVINPFGAGMGIIRVMCTDTEHVIVQTVPQKVVFAKAGCSLETYMQTQGYAKTNQEGAMYTFSKDDEVHRVLAHGPGHCAKWYWED